MKVLIVSMCITLVLLSIMFAVFKRASTLEDFKLACEQKGGIYVNAKDMARPICLKRESLMPMEGR